MDYFCDTAEFHHLKMKLLIVTNLLMIVEMLDCYEDIEASSENVNMGYESNFNRNTQSNF